MDQDTKKEIRTFVIPEKGLTIPVLGDYDEKSLNQIRDCLVAHPSDGALAGALMADHHPGYGMPVGGVLASEHYVAPSAVGVDIGCGNLAVRTNLKWRAIESAFPLTMDAIAAQISFGIGRNNAVPAEHPVLEKIERSEFGSTVMRRRDRRTLSQLASAQLGTVGSGNHYVDIFVDSETEEVWIGVHFGSRGFGHSICTGFERLAHGGSFADNGRLVSNKTSEPIYLDVRSPLGQSYLENMALAGEYALAGRELVVAKVLSIIGATAVDRVSNHHNFAWREQHDGLGMVWVTRKGATPAFPGQRGFVGGSMYDMSVTLVGSGHEDRKRNPLRVPGALNSVRPVNGSTPTSVNHEEMVCGVPTLAHQLLFSTVHGAGRVMSRTQATGRSRSGKQVAEPMVDFIYWWQVIKGAGIELRGGGADEAPPVYRRLHQVLIDQGDTISVDRVLVPKGVVMAGPDVADPYKD